MLVNLLVSVFFTLCFAPLVNEAVPPRALGLTLLWFCFFWLFLMQIRDLCLENNRMLKRLVAKLPSEKSDQE